MPILNPKRVDVNFDPVEPPVKSEKKAKKLAQVTDIPQAPIFNFDPAGHKLKDKWLKMGRVSTKPNAGLAQVTITIPVSDYDAFSDTPEWKEVIKRKMAAVMVEKIMGKMKFTQMVHEVDDNVIVQARAYIFEETFMDSVFAQSAAPAVPDDGDDDEDSEYDK